MILVTVGSTQHDNLIRAVDELVGEKKLKEKVICQVGKGQYEPINCEWFKFDPNIDEKYYKKCKTIICVDSAGTIFRNLEIGNKIIAVRHPTTKGATDLGKKLSEEKYIYFVTEPNNLLIMKKEIYKGIINKKSKKYLKPKNNIVTRITKFIIRGI